LDAPIVRSGILFRVKLPLCIFQLDPQHGDLDHNKDHRNAQINVQKQNDRHDHRYDGKRDVSQHFIQIIHIVRKAQRNRQLIIVFCTIKIRDFYFRAFLDNLIGYKPGSFFFYDLIRISLEAC